MHELGIVFQIIKRIEEVGQTNKLTGVSSVTLEVGEVSTIIDTYITDCWRWAADKSELLKGSNLVIESIPAVTFCENCEKTYPTVEFGKTCPHCGSGSTYLQSGSEVNIKDITAY